MGYIRGMSEITIPQIRAGRGMLGWTQSDLAERAGIAQRSLSIIECGRRRPHRQTLDALRAALESGGVRWTEGGGVEPDHALS